jgi:hypothetical protein
MRYAVVILLALTLPANAAENLASANSYLPDVETSLPTTGRVGQERHIKGRNAADLSRGSYTRRQEQAFACRPG